MTFELYAWRFHFKAAEDIRFPAGGAGNVLRGALGSLLRKVSDTDFRRVFAPPARAGTPSGFADPPRPFVLRATHLDGQTFEAGRSFHFDLHYFEAVQPPFEAIIRSFSKLAETGLGPLRARVRLVSVEQLDSRGAAVHCVYDGIVHALPAPLSLPLDAAATIDRLRVRFLSPTELKAEGEVSLRPEFAVLFSRTRDRLSTLRAFYGPDLLDIDFTGMRARAKAIPLTRCDLRRVSTERRSSRTGQVHPLGGFVGEAEYAGELTEFLPLLRVAQWTGIGRQTVWGKGEIAVHGYTSGAS